MRAGLAFSLVLHVALLAWAFALFASPAPFAPMRTGAITVELVPAAAARESDARPEQNSAPEAALGPQQPAQERKTRTAAAGSQMPAQQQAGAPPRAISAADANPAGSGQRPGPQPNADLMAAPALLVFDATVAPIVDVPLPSGSVANPAGGYDAPANSTAKLSREEIAALRERLQQCWTLPAEVAEAPKLRVVLRIGLRPNGSLSGSPTLIEASASPNGPALVAAATSALRKCQPYAFLPAAKYQEWKLLDLSFSPQGLAGG